MNHRSFRGGLEKKGFSVRKNCIESGWQLHQKGFKKTDNDQVKTWRSKQEGERMQ